jgi:hypothetical protein
MIDSRLIIERYDEESLKAIAAASETLHAFGIFKLQANANSMLFAERMTEDSPEELMKAILQVQQTNRNLLALHEWTGNFKKEVQS